jgi:hypothetical protein
MYLMTANDMKIFRKNENGMNDTKAPVDSQIITKKTQHSSLPLGR